MLDKSLSAAPDTATAAQVWAHLGNAPEAHNLPAPDSILVGTRAHIYLHARNGHTLTNLHTWTAWLGAGPLNTHVYESSKPGHMQRDIEAHATWRGWTIEVALLESVPVETVAVAFGQSGGAS